MSFNSRLLTQGRGRPNNDDDFRMRGRSASPSLAIEQTYTNNRRERSYSPEYKSPDSMNLEEFPSFSNGDVLIIEPNGNNYKLHSVLLKSSSSVFAQLFDETTPIRITAAQKKEGRTIRYKLKMVLDAEDPRLVSFVVKDSKAKRGFNLPPNINGVGSKKAPHYDVYTNLFRCVYNLDPDFGTGAELNDIVLDVLALLQAAGKLKAERVVRRTIESFLLGFGHKLWLQIAARPVAWSDVACRLQSRPIFREAICHLVGAWKMAEVFDKQLFSKLKYGHETRILVESKVAALDEQKKNIELKLQTFWPPSMKHANGVHRGGLPGRHAYAGDVYQWISLTVVRHYITEAMNGKLGYQREDGGAEFYRQIADGEDAYLSHEGLSGFYDEFHMTNKGKGCFEEVLTIMKKVYKPLVAPLLLDNTQASAASAVDGPRYPYLTCASVLDEEMPWKRQAQAGVVTRQLSVTGSATGRGSHLNNEEIERDSEDTTGAEPRDKTVLPGDILKSSQRRNKDGPSMPVSSFLVNGDGAVGFDDGKQEPSSISLKRDEATGRFGATLQRGFNERVMADPTRAIFNPNDTRRSSDFFNYRSHDEGRRGHGDFDQNMDDQELDDYEDDEAD